MKEKIRIIINNGYFQISLVFILAALGRWFYYRTGFNPGFEYRGLPFGDALEYDILAMNILQGEGFGHFLYGFKYQSFVVPFYPLFLTFVYSFFGHNYLVVKIVQAFVGVLNCLIVYQIGKKVFNQKIGFIAGLIMALYIPYMLLNFQLMRETIFNFLFGLSVLLLLGIGDGPRLKKTVICGIIIGLTSLTRPAGLILVIVSFIWLPFKLKKETSQGFKMGIMVALVSLLTISPWLLRNYLIHGGFIMASGGYRQFWTGANPKYEGDFYDRKAWHEILWREPYSSEMERSRRLNKEAWEFIKADPRLYLKYMHKRFDDLWTVKLPKEENKLDFINLALLCSFFIFWLGFLGMVRAVYHWKKVSLFILIFIFYSLALSIYGAVVRYRLPLEQFLVVFAGYFIYLLGNINRLDWRNFKEVLAPGDKFEANLIIPVSPVIIRIRKVLLGLSIIVVFMFTVRLCWAYFSYQPPYNTKTSDLEVVIVLTRNGVYKKWLSQPKQINYKDIFEDQRQHNGYISNTRGAIIIWTGEINYLLRTNNGEVYKFSLVLNPQPHYFGGEDVACERAATARPQKTKDLKEGDIVAIVGRITTRDWLPERPCVEFFDVIPVRSKN